MRKREVAAVAVRLFALGALLSLLRTTSTLVAVYERADAAGSAAVTLVWAIVIIVSYVMLRYPLGVAALLLPSSSNNEQVAAWSTTDVVATACIVVGLYVLSLAVIDVTYWMAFLAVADDSPLPPERIARIWVSFAELGLSVAFILRSRRIASWVEGHSR